MGEATTPARQGKIKVGEMRIEVGKGKVDKGVDNKTVEGGEPLTDEAKEMVKKTKNYLGQKHRKEARWALMNLISADLTNDLLNRQYYREQRKIMADTKIGDPHKAIDKLTKQYNKLMEIAKKRGDRLEGRVDKLKKSKDKELQCLGYDIDIASKKAQLKILAEEKTNAEKQLKAGKNEETGEALTPKERSELDDVIRFSEEQSIPLNGQLNGVKKDGKTVKKGLLDQRKELFGEKPDMIQGLADTIAENIPVVLTDEDHRQNITEKDKRAQNTAKAEEDGITYIMQTVAAAVVNPESMDRFTTALVKAKLLDEADKKKFIEEVGLHEEFQDKAARYGKYSGLGVLSILGIFGMLGYFGAKKNEEGGRGPG